jgi:hypothetical protein
LNNLEYYIIHKNNNYIFIRINDSEFQKLLVMMSLPLFSIVVHDDTVVDVVVDVGFGVDTDDPGFAHMFHNHFVVVYIGIEVVVVNVDLIVVDVVVGVGTDLVSVEAVVGFDGVVEGFEVVVVSVEAVVGFDGVAEGFEVVVVSVEAVVGFDGVAEGFEVFVVSVEADEADKFDHMFHIHFHVEDVGFVVVAEAAVVSVDAVVVGFVVVAEAAVVSVDAVVVDVEPVVGVEAVVGFDGVVESFEVVVVDVIVVLKTVDFDSFLMY